MRLFGEGFGDRHCSPEAVSSFLDGAMGERETRRVEAHVAFCSHCAQHVEEMRSVVNVLRMMPTVPAPRSFAIPAPAPVLVLERPYTWWRPAPVAGFRAMAAAAALALAVVFAGDATGVIGTHEAPIQVGMVQPAELVSPGNPPGPEPSQVLGQAPVLDTVPDGSQVLDTTADDVSAQTDATFAGRSGFQLELWALEIGLLALTAVMAAASILLRRRAASS